MSHLPKSTHPRTHRRSPRSSRRPCRWLHWRWKRSPQPGRNQSAPREDPHNPCAGGGPGGNRREDERGWRECGRRRERRRGDQPRMHLEVLGPAWANLLRDLHPLWLDLRVRSTVDGLNKFQLYRFNLIPWAQQRLNKPKCSVSERES